MKKYVFITNSTKPSEEVFESLEEIKLDNVSRPCLEIAIKMGYEVILGVNRKYPEKLNCSELPIKFYDSHTYRSILSLKDNYTAYKNLCNLLKKGEVEVIHCNTPVGGLIGRICGKKYKVKKVIYTAHGFHFYKGAPIFNNTVLKWAEKIMAHWTDVLITLNEEDYQAAKKMKLKKNGKVYKIPGVGIETNVYKNICIDRNKLRQSINIKDSDFVCISIGRLDKNKNNKACIESIYQMHRKDVHLIICGEGDELNELLQLVNKLGMNDRVHFLGFRKDIPDLLYISDIFISLSEREGLPRVTMEAMAAGLPCIVSEIRGNVDLIDENKGGYIISSRNIESISQKINFLVGNKKLCNAFGKHNQIKIENFNIINVRNKLIYIYNSNLREEINYE